MTRIIRVFAGEVYKLLRIPLLLYWRNKNKNIFDVQRMIGIINSAQALTNDIEKATEKYLEKTDNKGFFKDIWKYDRINLALPFKSNLALYAPNVACIDYLLKNSPPPSNKIILDYACGMGNLLIYLRFLGYNDLLGYDNFQQVRERTILTFLHKFDMEAFLLSDRKFVQELKPDVVIIIGVPFDWLDLDTVEIVLNKLSTRTVIIEHKYAHIFKEYEQNNWNIRQQYFGLITVFEKS